MKEGTVLVPPYHPSAKHDDDVLPVLVVLHCRGAQQQGFIHIYYGSSRVI